jgi:hypothetical protein
MINVKAFDRPLFPVPDCGVYVFTYAVPGFAIRLYGTEAFTSVASRYVVQPFLAFVVVQAGSLCPFHSTTVLAWNPFIEVASTNSVKHGFVCPLGVFGQFGSVTPVGVPAGSPDGEIFVIVAPVLYCTELL